MNPLNLPLDGYGLPFDPERHLAFVLASRGDESFVNPSFLTAPPLYITPKDKPAGWYDKSDKITHGL